MSNKKLIVYIGRFQLPHNGHYRNIQQGLRIAKDEDGEFLCIIGSCDMPRTYVNLFTYEERCQMIQVMFPNKSINFEKSVNFFCDNEWLKSIVEIIAKKYRQINSTFDFDAKNIEIIGHSKEDSKWYIDLIQTKFKFRDLGEFTIENKIVNSTELREMFINDSTIATQSFGYGMTFRESVHQNLIPWLMNFRTANLDKLADVKREMIYYKDYQKSFKGPFPVQFLAADAVFVNYGFVLLGRRKKTAGKGLLAIPGGFVNPDETFFEAAKRELFEETCLTIKSDVEDCASMLFDNPNRSMRGRVVTMAFLFNGSQSEIDPRLARANDDLEKLEWIKLSDLHQYRDQMFEDHYFIITELTKRYK